MDDNYSLLSSLLLLTIFGLLYLQDEILRTTNPVFGEIDYSMLPMGNRLLG
jgi:hypothetical protein